MHRMPSANAHTKENSRDIVRPSQGFARRVAESFSPAGTPSERKTYALTSSGFTAHARTPGAQAHLL